MNFNVIVAISSLVVLNLTFSYSLTLHHVADVVSSNFTCSCDWRYLKHYETKGCKAIYRDRGDCTCPIRFQCPKLEIDPDVCRLNGQTHQLGESVKTSNPCEICHCRRDYANGKATIQCIPVECPNVFRPPATGCYLYYEEGRCCPTQKCGDNTKNSQRNKVCTYKGKDYKIGQKIYSEEDPCLICRCTENWTGLNNGSCSYFSCDLEKDIHKLSKGCIPIYHDKTCCPIEYHCTEETTEDDNEEPGFEGPDLCQEEPVFGSCHESFTKYYYNNRKGNCEEFLFSGCKGNRNNFASPEECEAVCGTSRPNANDKSKKENMCYFDHRFYSVGDILDIKHPTNCVTCTCHIPPDFSCVHRSCPPPPNNDYENCQANYKANSCCAEYNCTVKAQNTPVSYIAANGAGANGKTCPEVNCEGCRIVQEPGECPACECSMICEKPQCEEGCVAEDLGEDPSRCPGCRCSSESPKAGQQRRTRRAKQCIPPKCICPTTACEEGCHLDRNVSYGQCPICVCTGTIRDDDLCIPPRCFCSNPNCNEGCEIDTDVRDGRCPGCKCKPSSFLSTNQRPSVTARKPQRCPPEECPSNCKLEMHPSNGQCPVCICKFDKEPTTPQHEYENVSRQNLQPSLSDKNKQSDKCPSLNCPDCPKTHDAEGCLTCDCRQTNNPATSRPVNWRPSSTMKPYTTSTLPPCQEEICQAPYCRSVLGDDGCPTCQCSNLPSACVRPECSNNCALKNKPGECPTCVCPTRSTALDRSNGRPSTRTCQNESCHGIKCKLIPGENGCQKCVCEGPCKPITCERGCTRIDNPGIGKCPYCLCSFS